MLFGKPDAARRGPLAFAVCATTWGACLLAVGGCTDSIRQYTRFGDWTRPVDKPVVLSGDPRRDAAAHQAGSKELSEADWEVLEKIAPRPVWERITDARRESRGEGEEAEAASRSSATAPAGRQEVGLASHRAAADFLMERLLRRMESVGEDRPEIVRAEPRPGGQKRVTTAETMM